MKGVQCYELFGGIALKIHTFPQYLKTILMNAFNWVKQTSIATKSMQLSSNTNIFYLVN